jgi:transcriptional regulator with XRE-family HTH domain
LAQRLGIPTGYLSQLENNQRPLTVQVLLALNTAFGSTSGVLRERRGAVDRFAQALSDAAFGETMRQSSFGNSR